MRDRNLPPGKALELGEQVRLVAFDRDQVTRAAAVKVFGMVPLSVQGIGGDHSVPDVYLVQQHAEPGADRVTVIGHSTGATVATALAEQRPDKVAALALIDMGPNPDAKIPESLLIRLLLAWFPGRLLWLLKTEAAIRKATRTAFARPVDIPDAIIKDMMRMTYRAFAGTLRAPLDYLGQRSLPDRLASPGIPVLVIFGIEDRRWHSSSAAAYRAVPGTRVELLPGVGHTPMLEDPQATGTLPLEFAAATAHLH